MEHCHPNLELKRNKLYHQSFGKRVIQSESAMSNMHSPMEIKQCESPTPVMQNKEGLHLSPSTVMESMSSLQSIECTSSPQSIRGTPSQELNQNVVEVEEINTEEVAYQILSELKKYNISQAVFAKRVLGQKRKLKSDILRFPKPWSKLRSGKELFRMMWKWLQEPEIQRVSALLKSMDNRCYVCKKLCVRTGYSVSVENCSWYGIPEADVQSNTRICMTCYLQQINVDSSRKPTEEDENNDNEMPKSKNKSQLICDEDEPVCSEGKCNDPVCSESKCSEQVFSEGKCIEPVICECKFSKPVVSEVKCSKPVFIEGKCNEPVYSEIRCNEPVYSELKGNETVCNEKTSERVKGLNKETQSTCAAVLCRTGKRAISLPPLKFGCLPWALKEAVKSKYGIIDENKKLCTSCYTKVNKKCIKLYRVEKADTPSCSHRTGTDTAELSSAAGTGKQSSMKKGKLFACGWCKFQSVHSSTVMRHHCKKHVTQELDIVRLKALSPKCKSPYEIEFNCDSCDYSGRLRHQLHLHNDRCHQNSLNRDGITDCESDDTYSPVYPYFYYNMTLPRNYFQMQQKYKLKDMKIPCTDIFKSGLEYLMKKVYDQGISKLCVDRLTEEEFVSMATLYREDVSYNNTRVENYVPVNLERLEDREIKSIIKN